MPVRKVYQTSKKPNLLPIIVGAIFLISIGILIGTIMSNITPSSVATNAASEPILYNTEVIDIASHFLCSCGSCGDKELVSCTCNTAIQEKDFIQDLIQKGYEKEAIITTVENMFGKKKS